MTILGCQKDPSVDIKTDELYTPYLTSVRDNGKITLMWGKPACLYCANCPCPQLDPNHFEIFVSDSDPSDLKFHSTVSNNIFEVAINNLTNGKPYYFAIRAVGQKEFTVSKTVMTIPENAETVQPLFPTIDNNKELGTWSNDQSKIGYISSYFWNNGNNESQSLFVYSFSNNAELLVEKSSRSPEWSPTGQKIVYQTENGMVNSGQGMPCHISVYNTTDSTIKRLTSGSAFNFLPTWSFGGEWIAFLSNKAGGQEYNIWKIPSDSGTAVQVTLDFNDNSDLGIIDDRSPKSLSWSKDGNNIAFSRLTKLNQGYNSVIYTIPSSGGSKTILVPSQWDDYAPTYSPDGTTIAFVSNRSGKNEIWTMNLQTKKFKQITGSKDKWIYANPGKIEWSLSGNKILFTSNSNNFKTLYTVDIN